MVLSPIGTVDNGETFFSTDDYEMAIEKFYAEGWTDGLPIVLPTRKLVDAVIAASGRDRNESLGTMPPKGHQITIEKLAINAVMGGCTSELFPVVIAGIEAMLDPEHNLNGVIQTTHPCVSLAIVGGPVAKQLNFNSGDGVFGNGYRANAAVGRALRLAMWNLGGALPGVTDMATMSSPAEYAYCIAESEDSPWEPLHVERGCPPGSNGITMFACEGPQSLEGQGTPDEMLYVIGQGLRNIGHNNAVMSGQSLLVLNPRQAHEFAAAGWTKKDVRDHLWENGRPTVREISMSGAHRSNLRHSLVAQGRLPARFGTNLRTATFPATTTPEDLLIVVAGGQTYFAALCPGWGALGGYAVTKPIALRG
jgi:hypothetical protein